VCVCVCTALANPVCVKHPEKGEDRSLCLLRVISWKKGPPFLSIAVHVAQLGCLRWMPLEAGNFCITNGEKGVREISSLVYRVCIQSSTGHF